MAKRKRSRSKKSRKVKGSWRAHFGATAKACFREGPTSGKALGKCMKDNL